MSFLAKDCARARESVSVQLDEELPEPELARLDNHLLGCPDCLAWAHQVRDVTLQMREAPLEAPATHFVQPGLRRSWRFGSAVAVVSGAAVVATMFFAPARQNASLGSLLTGAPRANPTYDVSAGVVYPPHPALGTMVFGVSEPNAATGPVRAI